MKRFCVFFSVLFLFWLVGCTDAKNLNKNKEAELDITAFTAWLDSEGFVPEMLQLGMHEKMDSYTYKGQSVDDATVDCFYDGLYGGGYIAGGENFGFANDYRVSEDGKTEDNTYSFYTKVPLDGFTLPLGIEFEDVLHDVMAKLGITENLLSNFTSDEGTDVAMTLYKDERYTLVFKNWYLSNEPIVMDIPYELIFTENYAITHEGGKESNVTRIIKWTFTPNENMLHEFSVEILENYKLK